jgi:hypothetical protein
MGADIHQLPSNHQQQLHCFSQRNSKIADKQLINLWKVFEHIGDMLDYCLILKALCRP